MNVNFVISTLNLFPRASLSAEEVAKAIALIDEHCSLHSAVAAIGAAYSTVRDAVKRFREMQNYSRKPESGQNEKLQPVVADLHCCRF